MDVALLTCSLIAYFLPECLCWHGLPGPVLSFIHVQSSQLNTALAIISEDEDIYALFVLPYRQSVQALE